jgi:glycosyltransferase involved in cell wall biosynthesis
LSESISIIIPTISRDTLVDTINSIQELYSKDQVIIVGDGPQPKAERIFKRFKLPGMYLEGLQTGCYGMAQRNFAMKHATGKYLLFMDDDDIYTENALKTIRSYLDDNIHIFKMELENDIIWKEPIIERGNVGTPMFAVPNKPSKLGIWPEEYCGDFEFIKETVKNFKTIFHTEIIAKVRPNG